MITIHQRNQNVSNDDDTFSKSAQNSLPWVLPDKYITDQLTIQLILSLLALFSLFLPSTNKSLFEKSNVLPSLMTNNSSMNRISISNSTYVQISCVNYIPNLANIQTEKFLVLPTKSWNDTNTCSKFTIFLDSPYSLDDKIRATVQLITYTVPQNCLSIFTIHNSQLFYLCPCQLRGWASDFFSWGSLLGRIPVSVKIKVYNVFYTLIPSFIPDISLAKCFHVKIAHWITLEAMQYFLAKDW